MSRRLKVDTTEMGRLELYLIYEVDGIWEEEWRPLQGVEITNLITSVTKTVMDDCLNGFSKPLFKALGLAPWATIIKLPVVAATCARKEGCVFYDRKTCFPRAKKMPFCFEPNVSTNEDTLRLGAELIRLWREGVYVVLVKEDTACPK